MLERAKAIDRAEAACKVDVCWFIWRDVCLLSFSLGLERFASGRLWLVDHLRDPCQSP